MRRICTVLLAIAALTWSLPAIAAEAESQPASRPASQPTSQPASQPASQPTSGPTTSAATTTTSTTTATTSSQAAEEKKDEFLAVINGRVYTVTGPTLERATVLCKNGVIEAIGTNVPLPQDCTVIDADGKFVYPGLIAASASGLHGGSNPQDSTNVYSLAMEIALAGGITTAVSNNTASKLTFGSTKDMVIKDNLFTRIAYSRSDPAQRAELRQDLEKVRDYLREERKYQRQKEKDKDAKPPDKSWLQGKYESYRKLLTGQAVASASAQLTQDLRDLAELADTFGFELVIYGAYEGWCVAPTLGRADVRAVISPRGGGAFGNAPEPDDRLNRPNGPTIENARILHDHGVPVAVVPATSVITLWGLAGRDLLHLNMEAAFAVRGGLSNDDALRTITIDAARILGIDDRVGSIEVGKDADLVVADGDILHYMTQVHDTIVNGRVAYKKSGTTLFAHIRPEGKVKPVEFDDQWPRRLAWPEE